jgi:hypothetical protein
MADTALHSMTQNTTPALADEMYLLDDPAGTPADNRVLLGDALGINTRTGGLINGRINAAVTSNNLTASVITMGGSTPTSANPVYVNINGTIRKITAALTKTVTAGTNTFNAGAAEFATVEQDYFVYLAYKASDGSVQILYSRIPYANVYGDFSTTATNEKYAAFSSAPASTDDVVLVGRFAATNSGTASFNWSVPTFTSSNMIQRPIFVTRWLTYTPQWAASGSMTFTSVTTSIKKYMISYNTCIVKVKGTGTTGGTASNAITATLPFNALDVSDGPLALGQANDTGAVTGRAVLTTGTPNIISMAKYDGSNWALAAGKIVTGTAIYEI